MQTPLAKSQWVCLAFLCGLYLLFISPYRAYLVDDAFITYRYAENLRDYGELAYNPGEHEEGYTSFLWVVLLAVGSLLPLPIMGISKCLSLFSVWGIFYWFRLVSSSNRAALALFALWVCVPITWMNGVNGMETMFYTFLLTGQTALAIHFWENPSEKSAWKWGVVGLLCGLTRPEGNLFSIFFGLRFFFSSEHRRVLLRPALILGAVGVIYFVGRIFYFHYPMRQPWPNPFLFKVSVGDFWKSKGITYVLGFLQEPLFPLLALGVFFQFLGTSDTGKRPRNMRFLLGFPPLIALLVFFLTVEPIVEYFYRFLIPLLPCFLLLLLPSETHPWPSFKKALVGVCCSILLGFGIEYQKQSIKGLTEYYSIPLSRTHIPLGKALNRFYSPDYLLAVSDAGIIPYYAKWKTLDLVGLNYRPFLVEKLTIDKILAFRPTVVVLHDHAPGTSCNDAENLLLTSSEFHRQYDLAGDFKHRFSVDEQRKKMDIRVYLRKDFGDEEKKERFRRELKSWVEKAKQTS